MEANAVGFGFSAAAWRDSGREEAYLRFLDQVDYFRYDLEELSTSAEGDIGLAWGVHLIKESRRGSILMESYITLSGLRRSSAAPSKPGSTRAEHSHALPSFHQIAVLVDHETARAWL